MRACIVAERIGIRSVGIVCEGFLPLAKLTTELEGLPSVGIACYPGVAITDSDEIFREKVRTSVVTEVITGLQHEVARQASPVSTAPEDIVVSGSLLDVQERFLAEGWSDGLPIIPPTLDRVREFVGQQMREADEIVGTLPPANQDATVWGIAVNGVMAGCRPEYMPVLVAIVEAIADPGFRLQDAGSTSGMEPLIIVSGPIIELLAFNAGPGVLRVGRQANTSIGRFLRLYLRNVAGLRIPPHSTTDKATFGTTFNVALAENEEVTQTLGWNSFAVDRGFTPDESVVTVMGVVATSPPIFSAGDDPKVHLETITDMVGATCSHFTYFVGNGQGRFPVLVVISPNVATVLAKGGIGKTEIRDFLHRNARVSLNQLSQDAWHVGQNNFDLDADVEAGTAPTVYSSVAGNESVPVFPFPEQIGFVIAGDAARNQTRGFLGSSSLSPVSKVVATPEC